MSHVSKLRVILLYVYRYPRMVFLIRNTQTMCIESSLHLQLKPTYFQLSPRGLLLR